MDSFNGSYLPDSFGRCDREIKCRYHLKPRNIAINTDYRFESRNSAKKTDSQIYIPGNILESTLKGYHTNNFIKNLVSTIPYPLLKKDVNKVIELYCVGTYGGATSFPYIDTNGNITAIQLIRYDNQNHRCRSSFIHSELMQKYKRKDKDLPDWLQVYLGGRKIRCFFGAHLLPKFPKNTVAIVEAPKTAIIAALYFGVSENANNLLWLSSYNLQGLTLQKAKALRSRKVVFFPDLSDDGYAFQLWKNKATQLSLEIGFDLAVSRLLEDSAPEADRVQGYDLADYLLKMDWRGFRSTDI